jgi:hypothetical protein
MVLDLLCDFEEHGPGATYENVEGKVLNAGICTIRATFAESRPA